jgi:hypothetical protein
MVIHEVMHMVLTIPVTEEAKVVAMSKVIQPRDLQIGPPWFIERQWWLRLGWHR